MSAPPLASLPRVDRVAAHAALDAARRRLGAEAVTRLARRAIDEARAPCAAARPAPRLDEVARRAAAFAHEALAARARPVINATGVVLHTNLGRAPLARGRGAGAGGVGRALHLRSRSTSARAGAAPRAAFAESGLAQLAGAEAALVVNNNAAATLLALSALAMGRKVIVSRGRAHRDRRRLPRPRRVRALRRRARRGGHHQPHAPRRLRGAPSTTRPASPPSCAYTRATSGRSASSSGRSWAPWPRSPTPAARCSSRTWAAAR